MSDTTKLELERAPIDHLRDEELLDPGDLLTEFILIASAMPEERSHEQDSYILVATADGMPRHHGEGLAWSYLHLSEDERLR